MASCREPGSSIYTPEISVTEKQDTPQPPQTPRLGLVVEVCQHTTGYAPLFTSQLLSFVHILVGCRPLPRPPYSLCPFKVSFHWLSGDSGDKSLLRAPGSREGWPHRPRLVLARLQRVHGLPQRRDCSPGPESELVLIIGP